MCCAVKSKACIQKCGEVDDNVDQHNKNYSAERKRKKLHDKLGDQIFAGKCSETGIKT